MKLMPQQMLFLTVLSLTVVVIIARGARPVWLLYVRAWVRCVCAKSVFSVDVKDALRSGVRPAACLGVRHEYTACCCCTHISHRHSYSSPLPGIVPQKAFNSGVLCFVSFHLVPAKKLSRCHGLPFSPVFC
jgi:hypothetical protein